MPMPYEDTPALDVDVRFALVPIWVDDAPISDRAVRLYVRLRRYADNATGAAWPSRRSLANALRCSIDSIDRALTELVECGAISVERRFTDEGSPTSNLYLVRTTRTGVAAPVRPGSRGAAAGVAAPVRHELDPGELKDPPTPADAGEPCSVHKPRLHPNCRACGTSPRAQRARHRAARPEWCGHVECDPGTRMVWPADGSPPYRCLDCHPLTQPTGDSA